MKTILTLAFVLAAGSAFANGVKVKGKQAMAKSPPPVVQPVPGETRDSCLVRVASECGTANWTKLGKRACIRWKSRACR